MFLAEVPSGDVGDCSWRDYPSRPLLFPTDVPLVHWPVNTQWADHRRAHTEFSRPSALLNSLNDVNGTTQRLSMPRQRFQCFEDLFWIFVTPGSGSFRRSALKSNSVPLARSFSARLAGASICAFEDDGMHQRMRRSLRFPFRLATTGAL